MEAQATDLHHGRMWLRWSVFVQGHSWTIALASTLALLLIAAPATALRLGSSDASNDPMGFTTYKAYRLLAEGFGKGFNGPLQVVAQLPPGVHARGAAGASNGNTTGGGSPAPRAPAASRIAAGDLHSLEIALAGTADVVSTAPPRVSPSGEVATISVYPTSSPQEYATTQLVSRLRTGVIPALAAHTGMHVYVGGVTAGAVDFASVLSRRRSFPCSSAWWCLCLRCC